MLLDALTHGKDMMYMILAFAVVAVMVAVVMLVESVARVEMGVAKVVNVEMDHRIHNQLGNGTASSTPR